VQAMRQFLLQVHAKHIGPASSPTTRLNP
jgi:hypothetical protein